MPEGEPIIELRPAAVRSITTSTGTLLAPALPESLHLIVIHHLDRTEWAGPIPTVNTDKIVFQNPLLKSGALQVSLENVLRTPHGGASVLSDTVPCLGKAPAGSRGRCSAGECRAVVCGAVDEDHVDDVAVLEHLGDAVVAAEVDAVKEQDEAADGDTGGLRHGAVHRVAHVVGGTLEVGERAVLRLDREGHALRQPWAVVGPACMSWASQEVVRQFIDGTGSVCRGPLSWM